MQFALYLVLPKSCSSAMLVCSFLLCSWVFKHNHVRNSVQVSDLQGLKGSSLVDEKLEKVDKLKKIAEQIGATLPQLAIAWVAKNDNVSVVLMGATKEAQVCDPSAHLLGFRVRIFWVSVQELCLILIFWHSESKRWLEFLS